MRSDMTDLELAQLLDRLKGKRRRRWKNIKRLSVTINKIEKELHGRISTNNT